MSISKAYTDWSATYDSDRNLTRDLDAQVTRNTLAKQRYAAILELGCGTGKNTTLLTDIGGAVYALDFSEGMIRQAQVKNHRDNIVFSVADLTQSWPYANRSFDLATCNLVLEHINDLALIFSEAQRVLKPMGHFFICELHPFKQYQGAKARFQHDQERTEIPAFTHHISSFFNAAVDAGFRLTDFGEWWHDEDDPTLLPRLVSFMFEKKEPTAA